MRRPIASWLAIADSYLAWIEILGEKTEVEVAQFGSDLPKALGRGPHHTPSLFDLAHGNISTSNPSNRGGTIPLWPKARFSIGLWLAGETVGNGERLIREICELYESMNMRFLYDTERRLFSIGYNVSEGRPDGSYYDLLASAARGSGVFIAIARGDISFEHWFSM